MQFNQLKLLGGAHFSSLFMDDGKALIFDQLQVIKHFPSFLTSEDSKIMATEVLMMETESSLKSFKKDMIPRRDGCLVEFFIHFFDLVKPDLLKVVEQS